MAGGAERITMKPIRILLVDDHDLFREGLAGIINAQADMEIIGEASDGFEAVVKAQELKPNLILMDVQMPGIDGLETTRRIKQALPDTAIVMLTVRDDNERLFEAIKNGVQGYLLKTINSREMLTLLRGAVKGEAAISPSMAGKVLVEFQRMSKLIPFDNGMNIEVEVLTHREREVLDLAAQGLTDKEIAEKLSISINTVKSHIRNVLSKLQVNTRHEAARVATNKGLL
jgi:two-component system nitrate/nitrite response regulator NarL